MNLPRINSIGLKLALACILLRVCVVFVPAPVVMAANTVAGNDTTYVLICSVHGPMKIALGSQGQPASPDGQSHADLCPVCTSIAGLAWATPPEPSVFIPPAISAQRVRVAELDFQVRQTHLRATARAPPFPV